MNLFVHLTGKTAAGDFGHRLPETVVSQLGNLVQTLPGRAGRPRVLALVSAGPGEGTTTCVVNLARAFVDRHARVLMIDAHIRRPALHSRAGIGPGPGLMELLHQAVTLDRAVRPTAIEGLSILSAGFPSTVVSNGVVTPAAFRERILDAVTGVDFVIVDCPPVNVYEHAATIAAQCDGVVLVVEGGRTGRQAAQAAKRLLTRAECNILGVVINRRKYYVPRFLYDRL